MLVWNLHSCKANGIYKASYNSVWLDFVRTGVKRGFCATDGSQLLHWASKIFLHWHISACARYNLYDTITKIWFSLRNGLMQWREYLQFHNHIFLNLISQSIKRKAFSFLFIDNKNDIYKKGLWKYCSPLIAKNR